MRKLLLIRHSNSKLTSGIQPDLWPLTDEGRARCLPLADRVGQWEPAIIITSDEPKAQETGEIIAEYLGLPVETGTGLHEHRRPAFDKVSSQEEFTRSVERLFDEPDQLVYGKETALEALERFEDAVRRILGENEGNVAITSHGTVMALFVAKYNTIDVKDFWRKLNMPDLVVLDGENFRLLES